MNHLSTASSSFFDRSISEVSQVNGAETTIASSLDERAITFSLLSNSTTFKTPASDDIYLKTTNSLSPEFLSPRIMIPTLNPSIESKMAIPEFSQIPEFNEAIEQTSTSKLNLNSLFQTMKITNNKRVPEPRKTRRLIQKTNSSK